MHDGLEIGAGGAAAGQQVGQARAVRRLRADGQHPRRRRAPRGPERGLEGLVSEQRKIRVAVVFGGRGPEHQVSCMGGGNMLGAIDRSTLRGHPRRHHHRRATGSRSPTHPSGWRSPAASCRRWRRWRSRAAQVVPWSGGGEAQTGCVASCAGADPAPVRRGRRRAAGAARSVRRGRHHPGPAGDGRGALCRRRRAGQRGQHGQGVHEPGLRGQGPAGRAVRRDQASGTGRGSARPRSPRRRIRSRRSGCSTTIADLGWPLFVKPARGGSSIGTSKAHDMASCATRSRLPASMTPRCWSRPPSTASRSRSRCWRAINGAPPDTSLPGQLLVDGGEEFWDFEAKYLDAASGMAIPAPIPDGAIEEIRRLGAAAFEAVSCEGLARVDFFYTPAGGS